MFAGVYYCILERKLKNVRSFDHMQYVFRGIGETMEKVFAEVI